jgi:N-acetylglucosaminyl-diphospho-decaprenol L-rhamnosyltransferase
MANLYEAANEWAKIVSGTFDSQFAANNLSDGDDPRDLAVVIVSWNVKALLADCLASVFEGLAGSELDAEVWVVDNASHDGSAEMVRQQFPQVRLIASRENLGFAGGNNRALQAIGFQPSNLPAFQPSLPPFHPSNLSALQPSSLPRYVLLLNPDTEVRAGALSTMVRFMDGTPSAGVCGARLVYGDGSFQHSAFGFPGLAQIALDFFPLHWRLTESRLNGRYPRRLYEGDTPFEIDHPLGAAMMLRCEVILGTGLFDEGYRMYVEEIDWCVRIRRAGWEVYCVPSAVVVHHAGQSTRQVRNEMFAVLWRSRFRLFGQHYSGAFRWAARRLVRLGLWAEAHRAQAAHRRGELSAEALSGRLSALHQVAQLSI